MKMPTFAPVYVSLYPGMCEIAIAHGYSLAVHGSVVSDFDLIAAPWTPEAVEAAALVAAIAEYVSLICGANHHLSPVLEPEVKPHGRLAWCIPMGSGAAVDISVMPRQFDRD